MDFSKRRKIRADFYGFRGVFDRCGLTINFRRSIHGYVEILTASRVNTIRVICFIYGQTT